MVSVGAVDYFISADPLVLEHVVEHSEIFFTLISIFHKTAIVDHRVRADYEVLAVESDFLLLLRLCLGQCYCALFALVQCNREKSFAFVSGVRLGCDLDFLPLAVTFSVFRRYLYPFRIFCRPGRLCGDADDFSSSLSSKLE